MHDPHGTLMHRVERIHFIGVGGSGMSGIAEVLSNLGYKVSGSDQSSSRVTDTTLCSARTNRVLPSAT